MEHSYFIEVLSPRYKTAGDALTKRNKGFEKAENNISSNFFLISIIVLIKIYTESEYFNLCVTCDAQKLASISLSCICFFHWSRSRDYNFITATERAKLDRKIGVGWQLNFQGDWIVAEHKANKSLGNLYDLHMKLSSENLSNCV